MSSRTQIDAADAVLLELIDPAILSDLARDPRSVIEARFGPIGIQPLPSASMTNDECSCDGYYETLLNPAKPWILYDSRVSAERRSFTLLHELGHHLIASRVPELLDVIDEIAGPRGDPAAVEEVLCHRLAGKLLTPDTLLDEVVGSDAPRPGHLLELKEKGHASWEAAAVRLADRISGPGAVVLLREPGLVSFAATSTGARFGWPRNSRLRPGGALSRAFSVDARTKEDRYRWGLPYEEELFCDTVKVHDELVVAVMSRHRSTRGLSFLEEVEPVWKRRLELCIACNGERIVGWCDKCKGRFCRDCGRCGCYRPAATNRHCEGCGLIKPFRPGSGLCRDCES
ncbi:MAG: ImmA/IrrE family metallo-endopeptidase [Acidimicrobiia bacterium]|nr:ImmA/IrrE family metallo-endopeptidase [Acidimicrobiia bacterium]